MLTKTIAEQVRAGIPTAHIVNRLRDHIDGKIELSQTQVASAKILIDKALPSLQATEITAALAADSEGEQVLLVRLIALIQSKPELSQALRAHLSGLCAPVEPKQIEDTGRSSVKD